jgi:hypothetical protein
MTILHREPVTDPDWRAKAQCLGEDLDDFFPDSNDTAARRRAMALCAVCPVTTDCLIDALNFDDDQPAGIRGGLGVQERLLLRRKIGAPRERRRPALEHGYDAQQVYRSVRDRGYPADEAARLLGMTVTGVMHGVSRIDDE